MKIYLANSNHKEAGITILISDKIDSKTKRKKQLIEKKKRHFYYGK